MLFKALALIYLITPGVYLNIWLVTYNELTDCFRHFLSYFQKLVSYKMAVDVIYPSQYLNQGPLLRKGIHMKLNIRCIPSTTSYCDIN